MKYIKNKFDDVVSEVKRDYVQNYRQENINLIQVYPWEKDIKGKRYKIKEKYFIEYRDWEEHIKDRGVDIFNLTKYLCDSKKIQIKQKGLFNYFISKIRKKLGLKEKSNLIGILEKIEKEK